MRVITLNVNGIRSAARKGFFSWLSKQRADVVCLQEVKAQADQLTPEMLNPRGFRGYFHLAEKKGYSGVALYSRKPPDKVIEGIGRDDLDREGRYLEVRYGKLSVVSIYLPSGSSGEERQRIKFAFMDHFLPVLKKMRRDGRSYILCGDWNIAHQNIDLKNWRGNQKNSGFLPEERAWLSRLFDEVGYVDAFRVVNHEAEQYTWWSNRGQAWAKNVGWRIDYQIVTPELHNAIKGADIYKKERFSDHAPLTMNYDLEF